MNWATKKTRTGARRRRRGAWDCDAPTRSPPRHAARRAWRDAPQRPDRRAAQRGFAARHARAAHLSELSRELALGHSTVSGIVDRLQARGIVQRQTMRARLALLQRYFTT